MHIRQEVTIPMLYGNAPNISIKRPTGGTGPVNYSYLKEAMLQRKQQIRKNLNDFKDRNY